MDCPKCGASVPDGAVECHGCGIVLAKAAEAMDRAYLRQQARARQQASAPVPEKSSSSALRAVVIVVILGVCAFGAWKWYTNNQQSDFDHLAAEAKLSDGSSGSLDDGRASRRIWRLAAKFGIAVAVFAAGYLRLKSSLSP